MKVMYIGKNGCLPLKNGKTYEVIGELTILAQYLIKDDYGRTSYYDKDIFEEVKDMEIENVLELEYKEVFGQVAVKIKYQNEDILKRGMFEDEDIGVVSCIYPNYNEVLFIKEVDTEKDNTVFVIPKEKAEEIKERVRKINEKYGIRKRWRAKKGDKYFCITKDVGRFVVDKWSDDRDDSDNRHYNSNNYFKTREEAEKVLEKNRTNI